jgi:hypothetical protein
MGALPQTGIQFPVHLGTSALTPPDTKTTAAGPKARPPNLYDRSFHCALGASAGAAAAFGSGAGLSASELR